MILGLNIELKETIYFYDMILANLVQKLILEPLPIPSDLVNNAINEIFQYPCKSIFSPLQS